MIRQTANLSLAAKDSRPGRLAACPGILKALFPLLVLLFFSLGCSGTLRQLDSFKKDYRQQNYRAIAAREADCEPGDQGCSQVRLIRGEACFRLAKQGQEPKKHYACAAGELESGIRQTPDWETFAFDLERAVVYEHLCESLRNLQDLRIGDEARAAGERLLSAAEEFYRLEPDHPASLYFLHKARFRRIQPLFPEAGAWNRKELCRQIKAMLLAMQEGLGQAVGTGYEPNYRLFIQELKTTRQRILECL